MGFELERPYEFDILMARGLVPDAYSIRKFGYNKDVDSGSPEDIFAITGSINWPTTADVHNILSGSAVDAYPSGTGLQQIQVYGIDDSWALADEEINLNGTSFQATSNSYYRIYRMAPKRAGSGQINGGTILALHGATALTTNGILLGDGQSAYAAYTVPAGYTAYMMSAFASISRPTGSSNGTAKMRIKSRHGLDTAYPYVKFLEPINLSIEGTSIYFQRFANPIPFQGPCDVWWSAETSVDNTEISAAFDLWVYAD